MKFVHPEILWGLGALAIPIIVHLFNFRKFKKVLFSNVDFLKEIKHETKNKSKIKHFLILLARMFAITALVLAFAQPYVPVAGDQSRPGDKAISIYIDNSFSMEAENEGARLLEVAKNKAFEIVNAFKPTDKFQLITNDFEGRHQRLVSKEEMTQLIQEVNVSPVSRSVADVVSRQKDLFAQNKFDHKSIYLISDFQSSTSNIADIANDASIQMRFIPTQAENQSNLYIDSLWFESPVRKLNQTEVMYVRVVNAGEEEQSSIPLDLSVNGQQKSVASVSIGAQATLDIPLSFTQTDTGIKHAVVKLDDHPVVFDDAFYFSYTVAAELKIMDIQSTITAFNPVQAVFADDPYFVYTPASASQIDFNALAQQNLVVLNQLKSISSGLQSELQKFVANGGSVLIAPGLDMDMASYNQLLQTLNAGEFKGKIEGATRVSTVDFEHYLYKNAFEKPSPNTELPVAAVYYDLALPQRSTTTSVLSFQTGSPLLTVGEYEGGRVYVITTPLDRESSGFVSHSFFPTSLLRMAEFSQSNAPLYYSIGSGESITLRQLQPGVDQTFRLQNISGGEEWIPEHRSENGNTQLYMSNLLHTAGNYRLTLGDSAVASLSFNYNRDESNTAILDASSIQDIITEKGWTNARLMEASEENLAAEAGELEEGKKYWWTMIIWTLIFLAIEIILLKFWKR